MKAVLGPDYTICKLTPRNPKLLHAELFIDGHWELPTNSRFAGFSNTPVGDIAWFYGTDSNSSPERMAFIPTDSDHPDVALLVIHGGSLQEAAIQREALLMTIIRASMIPGNSIKPEKPF